MSKREGMREKSKLRKEKEIEEFLNDVDVLHNNLDSVTIPSIGIKREIKECFIGYYITKYPNMNVYQITRYKKDHPFNITYHKEYYKNDIPEKYREEFSNLEKYFN